MLLKSQQQHLLDSSQLPEFIVSDMLLSFRELLTQLVCLLQLLPRVPRSSACWTLHNYLRWATCSFVC